MSEHILYAPSRETAERLLRRLLPPGAVIHVIEELPGEPVTIEGLRAWWTEVKVLANRRRYRLMGEHHPRNLFRTGRSGAPLP